MEPPSYRQVSVENPASALIDAARLEDLVRETLIRFPTRGGNVTLIICSSEDVRILNRRFRNQDVDTDVLTFPTDPMFPDSLGEIYISTPYASKQAALRGWTFEQEVGHLVIHGALHLAGFEDETEVQRQAMLEAQNAVALACGLPTDSDWSSVLHGISDAIQSPFIGAHK
jgi:rRNA maturation RNase YbeY